MPGLSNKMTPAFLISQPVVRICDDTVVKVSPISRNEKDCAEVNCINFVRNFTTIPVPGIRRTVQREGVCYILMEYVDGTQVAECWGKMTLWQKMSLACTLRRYFKQLRLLKGSVPGPPAVQPLECEALPFGSYPVGPFADFQALANHFLKANKRLAPLFKSRELVFSHNDLNIRNLLIGIDGTVWLLDWQFAGFYPQWLDPLAMWFQAISWYAQWEDKRFGLWLKFLPFIFNPSFRQWKYAVRTIGAGKMFLT
jgi:aminoglycoside phosphotransferase (APT) family kinase protein